MLTVAVAKYLDDQLSDLVYDDEGTTGNLFVEYMPSTPDLCVVVKGQPGRPQLTRAPYDLPGLQFIVRGARNDLDTPYALARSILSQLNGLDGVLLDHGGDDEVRVHGITASQTEPLPMGQDDNQRFEFSINFQCQTHAPTAHRPAINA